MVSSLAETLKRALPGKGVLVNVILALMTPEVDYFLMAPIRNGSVTVTLKFINGKLTYVQPRVETDLKVGVDVTAAPSQPGARPN